jgi:hypothetical protein
VWGIYVPVKKETEILDRKKEMIDERHKTLSEKHLERIKRKNLNIELSETFNKMNKFRRLEKSFGKVLEKKLFYIVDNLFK